MRIRYPGLIHNRALHAGKMPLPRWADCISLDDENILRYHVEQTDTEM